MASDIRREVHRRFADYAGASDQLLDECMYSPLNTLQIM